MACSLVLSLPIKGTEVGSAGHPEWKREEREKEGLPVPRERAHPPSSVGWAEYPVYSEMVPGGPSLSQCRRILRHREKPQRLLAYLPLDMKLDSAPTREYQRGFALLHAWVMPIP